MASWEERKAKADAHRKHVDETQGGGWQRLGAGLAIPAIGATYGERAIVPFNRYVNDIMTESNRGDSTVSQSTVDSFISKHNLPVEIHKSILTHPFPEEAVHAGPHVIHMRHSGLDKHHVGMIGTNDNGVLMHEIGHIVAHDNQGKAIKLTKDFMHHWDKQVHPGFMSAALASNDDTRAYAGIPLVLGDAADSINEMQANVAARKHILSEQGTAAARKFTRQMIVPNTLSYASVPVGKLGGMYAAGKLYEHVRDKYQMNKKASHLPLHLEILKDFSVIGAADLAALAAYDHIHRNDPTPAVRIETPTSENRYINHIVKQAAASRIALRKVTQGTDALAAKDGAYTRSLSHMPSEKDSIVKTSEEEQTTHNSHILRNMAIGAAALSAPRFIKNIRITKALNKHNSRIDELLSKRNKAIDFNDSIPNWSDPRRIDIDALEHELSVAKSNRFKASEGLNTDYLNPALAGGVLGLAASKVSSMRQASREKQASDSEQEQYTPHYARNAALTGAALSVPGLAYAGNAALHLRDPNALTRFMALHGVAIGGIGAGAGIATGVGLGLAATGVNHYLHRAREKQANWFTSGLDEAADVLKGTSNLAGSFKNHLTGRNVKEHMIDVVQPRGGKAVHELNKKTDLERYALTSDGSPNHAKLHDLIQKRKASRALAGGVVGAGALNYSRDTNTNGQNYGMVYQ